MGKKDVIVETPDSDEADIFGAAFDEMLDGKPDEPEEKEEIKEPEIEEPAPAPPEEPKEKIDPEKLATMIADKMWPREQEEANREEEVKEEVEPEDYKKFKEDWPEHAQVFEKQKAEIQELRKALSEAVGSIQERLNPVLSAAERTAEEKHIEAITKAHPDAFDRVNEINEWVDKQPSFLKNTYRYVLDNGTTSEVIEFLNLYKGQGGSTQKTPPDTEARLKKMETPNTVRTSVTSEPDPDDFDSAFEAEVKKYNKSAY